MEIIQRLTGRTEIWFGKDPRVGPWKDWGKYCINISETQMDIIKIIGCVFLFVVGLILGKYIL